MDLSQSALHDVRRWQGQCSASSAAVPVDLSAAHRSIAFVHGFDVHLA